MSHFFKNQQKLKGDLLLNYTSLAFMASYGLVFNILLGASYGPKALGFFNIVYAIYIVFSQLCVLGIHQSVLRYLPLYSHQPVKLYRCMSSAMSLAFFFGLITMMLLYLMKPLLSIFTSDPYFSASINLICPGIVLFAVNKIFIAGLNGLHRMRLYASLQIIRYSAMIAFLMVSSWYQVNYFLINGLYFFAECIVFIVGLFFYKSQLGFKWLSPSYGWIVRHLKFGLKAFGTGIAMELNSRLDILILAFFSSDTVVGVYSFSATFAEGLFQVLIVLRNYLNPSLSYLTSTNNYEDLKRLTEKFKKIALGTTVFFSCLGIGVYFFITHQFEILSSFSDGIIYLVILSLGILISSPILPFTNLLAQAGFPGSQTIQCIAVVVMNFVLNTVFIYAYGAMGCAVATALASYILNSVLQTIFVRNKLRFNIALI